MLSIDRGGSRRLPLGGSWGPPLGARRQGRPIARQRLAMLMAAAVPLLLSSAPAWAEAWFECQATAGTLCTFRVFQKSTSDEIAQLVLSAGETDTVDETRPGKGDTWCGSLHAFLDGEDCDRQPIGDLNVFP